MPFDIVRSGCQVTQRLQMPGIVVGVASLVWTITASAQSKTPIPFEDSAAPLLEENCAKCHSGTSPQAGLDVRSRAGLMKGGGSGPAIVVGTPDQSLLIKRISNGEMPPGGPRLTPAQLEILRSWIEAGAPARNDSPAGNIVGTSPAERAHWAFQSPKRPSIPVVKNAARVRSPIDALLLAALEKQNLGFSADAGRVTLIRRAYFDLIGLPPASQDVDRFLADTSQDAYEKVIEKLLSSPRYGERWARHWLDVAGYADSEGVLAADVIRPNAWRYRDYVIRAFNSDKPYDRFITEQLAGDELEDFSAETLIATGFYRLGPWDDEPADPQEDRFDQLDDMVNTTSQVFLGLTLACARCHNHKFEPLTMLDYYRMAAIFNPLERPKTGRDDVDLPIGSPK